MRRTRAVLVLCAVAAAVGLAACTPEEAAWVRYKSEVGGDPKLESPPEGAGAGAKRLLARVDGGRQLIDVAEFDGARWATAAEITLPPPGFEFSVHGRAIQLGDVTDDGRTDYLVPLEAAQTTGVVVSEHDGSWRTLPTRVVVVVSPLGAPRRRARRRRGP